MQIIFRSSAFRSPLRGPAFTPKPRLAAMLFLLAANAALWSAPANAEAGPVPDVTGLGESAALAEIEAAGFAPEVVAETLTVSPAGSVEVLAQEPMGGASADTGSAVALTVSRPAAFLSKYVGLPGPAAYEQLSEEGIPYLVRGVDQPDEASDIILTQDPPGGQLVPLDVPIVLDVNNNIEFWELSLPAIASGLACLSELGNWNPFDLNEIGVGGDHQCESFLNFELDAVESLAGATIESAELQLFVTGCKPDGSGPLSLEVRPAAAPWNAGNITWEDRPAGLGPPASYNADCSTGPRRYPDVENTLTNYAYNVASGAAADYGLALSTPDIDSALTYAAATSHTDSRRPRFRVRFHPDEPMEGELLWLRTAGADQSYNGLHTVNVARDGSVYAVGNVEGEVEFARPPGSYRLDGGIDYRVGVAKWDTDGLLRWAGRFEGNYDIAAAGDPAGNLYIAGAYGGFPDLDPGRRIDRHGAVDRNTVFVLKLSPDGALQWVQTFDSERATIIVADLAIGPHGSIYLGGYFDGAVDFGPGPDGEPVQLSAESNDLGFAAALTNDGAVRWARSFGDSDGRITTNHSCPKQRSRT